MSSKNGTSDDTERSESGQSQAEETNRPINRDLIIDTILDNADTTNDHVEMRNVLRSIHGGRWAMADVIRSNVALILKWRQQLLTRDWRGTVHSLTSSTKDFVLPAGHEELCGKNLSMLLVELIRHCDRTVDLTPMELTKSIENTIRSTPVTPSSDDWVERILEIALWHMSSDDKNVANEYLQAAESHNTLGRPTLHMINALKLVYEGLLIYQKLANANINFNDPTYEHVVEKMLRLLTCKIVVFRGAGGLLTHAASVLMHLRKYDDAVELFQRYIAEYPDDLSVYEIAFQMLGPNHGHNFGIDLINKAPWHPLVLEWCKYEKHMQSQMNTVQLSQVTEKLMQYLDYARNKNTKDAWILLSDMLESVNDNDRILVEAWKERKQWWSKYQLRNVSDDELRTLKSSVLKTLHRFEYLKE